MKNKLKGILYGTILGVLFGYGLHLGFSIPEVQMSHSTGECVKVINYHKDDHFTCENMPSRYNHVWVK